MGDPSLAEDPNVTLEELQLAARNHGMPLEGLRYDVTPAGMHYLLIHFDVPEVRPETWRLTVEGRVRSPLDLDLHDLQARETVTATDGSYSLPNLPVGPYTLEVTTPSFNKNVQTGIILQANDMRMSSPVRRSVSMSSRMPSGCGRSPAGER